MQLKKNERVIHLSLWVKTQDFFFYLNNIAFFEINSFIIDARNERLNTTTNIAIIIIINVEKQKFKYILVFKKQTKPNDSGARILASRIVDNERRTEIVEHEPKQTMHTTPRQATFFVHK